MEAKMKFNRFIQWFTIGMILIGFISFTYPVLAIDETITVDTTLDTNDPAYQVCSEVQDDCSLRGAISKANADPGTNYTVLIPTGVYTLTLEGFDEDENATGDLDVKVSLSLEGEGTTQTIIQAGASPEIGIDRVIHIRPDEDPINVWMSLMTIQHGKIPNNFAGAGIYLHHSGSTLYLDRVLVRDNLAEGYSYGGGMAVLGNLEADDTTFFNNRSFGEGGGIYQMASGNIVLERTTIYSNTAEWGGGFLNNSTATLLNVTISGNTATTHGGGISQWNNADLTMHYTTVTDNMNTASNNDWAIYNPLYIEAYNSIITAPIGKKACSHVLDDGQFNIGSDETCGLSVLIADPMLGPLVDNGGNTFTHRLGDGSPAIDAAGEAGNALPCPTLDQTLWNRPIDADRSGVAACDIGAFEARINIYLPIINRK